MKPPSICLKNGRSYSNLTRFPSKSAPKQSRPCVSLSWHENETNLLAIGHDRTRSDHCISVWDTDRGVSSERAILQLFGIGESAHSLCWDKTGRILLAGMSQKHLKMMDLRQNNAVVTSCNTRAINGVSLASNGRIIAGFIDNSIQLWDIRRIDKPILTHATEKSINNMCWCPTRNSTLATTQRDSPYVHLFDFHCSSPSEAVTDVVSHSIKRVISPFLRKPNSSARNVTINNISWHPYDVERMLCLSGSGVICDMKVQQRIAISWDPLNNLCGTNGVQLNCLNAQTPPSTPCESVISPWLDGSSTADQLSNSSIEDIVDIMHRRAVNDYGKLSDTRKNGELANKPALKSVWQMIAHMIEENCATGLREVAGISETVLLGWQDFPNGPTLKAYK